MKNKQFHHVGKVLKSNWKFLERDKINTPNTNIHDLSLSWLGTSTSVKSGRGEGGGNYVVHCCYKKD